MGIALHRSSSRGISLVVGFISHGLIHVLVGLLPLLKGSHLLQIRAGALFFSVETAPPEKAPERAIKREIWAHLVGLCWRDALGFRPWRAQPIGNGGGHNTNTVLADDRADIDVS